MIESSEENLQGLDSLNKSDNFSLLLPELPIDMQFNDGHRMAIVMYLGLMVVSATGNIYVLCSIKRMRKNGKLGRINLLLLNLATADLVVTFILMPLEIGWNATVSWRAGDLACRVLSFFRVFGLYLSGFVLMCICLDRYFAVIKPFAIYEAQRRGKKLLTCAWIASIFCSLPQSFIFHVERHPVFKWYEQCITFNSFPSPEYELAYNLFGFCVMYALPMGTILFCYSCILCRIHRVSIEKKNNNRLRRSSVTTIERAKMKTLKMTIITALVYTICWSPYNFISLWYWIDRDSAMQLDQRLQKAFFVFACTNSCVNPLIYGWYHVSASRRNQRRSSDYTSQYYTRQQTLRGGGLNKINNNKNASILFRTPNEQKCYYSSIRIVKNPSCSLPSISSDRRSSQQGNLLVGESQPERNEFRRTSKVSFSHSQHHISSPPLSPLLSADNNIGKLVVGHDNCQKEKVIQCIYCINENAKCKCKEFPLLKRCQMK